MTHSLTTTHQSKHLKPHFQALSKMQTNADQMQTLHWAYFFTNFKEYL